MAHAVFIQNPTSIYDDQPGLSYHFPRRYLGMVQETVGDWVIFYEGRKGALGYVSVQKVLAVEPDPVRAGHYYARLAPATLLDFPEPVGRADASGRAWERSLRGPEGRPMSGGASVSAVRRLSRQEFAAIVGAGLRDSDDAYALPRYASETPEMFPGVMAEEQRGFGHAHLAGDRDLILSERKYRDPAFQKMVKRAYGGRCAISGLSLRNGGGRPEVQAAHIRPVSADGPDTVRNGIALSGTLHWMFDRGLISVAEDLSILISHNKVPPETVRRLIDPGQKLILPKEPRHHPHPDYLRYHREEIFGRRA
ncbi:HNH endonuclease [Pseudooceanicola sp. CBS1P-1]|uniref:HNH endonuclease n=1 Tax=Pseudooceanicola albus TaxID=2692189 RepID=A0A6L7G9R2_9RHOB|nr:MULTISPECIES: HNH endonuclease [Pseudooceanicola]MBT9386664.1 HNH endonuclease [Pseudooceanicola endophyticus]MXN20924.1 HNH endonuclease [Pseudooceanicola albus]